MMLRFSCALTLTLKLKLRTKRKVFTKFGKNLRDPETEVQLKIPEKLAVKHDYKGNRNFTESPPKRWTQNSEDHYTQN